jgi:hypothetical protein
VLEDAIFLLGLFLLIRSLLALCTELPEDAIFLLTLIRPLLTLIRSLLALGTELPEDAIFLAPLLPLVPVLPGNVE